MVYNLLRPISLSPLIDATLTMKYVILETFVTK